MNANTKKTLLIALGIFVAIAASVAVVYMVRKPTPVTRPSPTPKPFDEAVVESPTTAPVFEVTPVDACSTSFVVACGSTPPSSTPSASPSGTPPVYPSPSPSKPPEASLDCVVKEVYADDSRNRSGFYYLETKIADASTLQSGTTVTYNIIAKNNGGVSTPDTKITDVLSTNLTFVDADSDCTYDSPTRTLTCTIGTLAAGAQAQRSFRATIVATSNTSIANKADVFSSNGQRDTCEVKLDATGKVVSPPPSEAPVELPKAGVFEVTAGTMGIGLLLLILGALGLLLI